MNTIVMYTDGGSRGNPGPSAIGVYIETLGKDFGEYIGQGTNNEAEYEALCVGLKKIKALLGAAKVKETHVICRMDSELVVKQLNHEYKIKESRIQEKFFVVWNLMTDFGKVTFEHVMREKNKRADAMVNKALDENMTQGTLL